MKKLFILFITVFLGISLFPVFALEEKLTLTITPPLIKINMNPGEVWSSSVKVVNNNPKDLQVFASVMDFKSGKEGGVEFIQKKDIKEGQSFLLSQWIEISSDPILIPAYQSKQVPFTIKVPEDAEPGGHYAAILVGTEPLKEEIKGTGIKVSALVSCLVLLNVQGEIIEEGRIREFSTQKTFYQKPEVEFTVRFENTGNVHIQPQGEIKIYNFFGKEREIIPINQKTEFGNVLPKSTRKWTFIWKGEQSPFEAGRYKAVLVLSYGSEAKQTVLATLYFWILPLKPTLGILGGFFLFFALLVLIVRAYLRRAITLAQKRAGIPLHREEIPSKIPQKPIEGTVIDLRKPAFAEKEEKKERKKGKKEIFVFLIRKYYRFCLILLIFILATVIISLYLKDVLKSKKSFEVMVKRERGEKVIISSEGISEKTEEAKPEEVEGEIQEPLEEIDKASTTRVLNGSGVAGAAAKTANLLRTEGFKIVGVGNAASFNYGKTMIIYLPGKRKEAELLNQFFDNKALLQEIETQKEDIVIIIGKDFSL